MKQLLTILSFSLFLLIAGLGESYGQLITDSESKLKTQKSKSKKEFSLFGNKKKGARTSSGPPQSGRTSTPNYSSGSPFASFNKRKSVSPRVSENRATLFKSYQNKSPRYSSGGLAGIMTNKRNAPRYSTGKPFSKADVAGSPRYSSGKPFSSRDVSVSPRYSVGKPFSTRDVAGSPRYSAGKPFSAKDVKASPRYSSGKPFSSRDLSVNPRYSAGKPFSARDVTVNPRYSAGKPFSAKDVKASPRYSSGKPFSKRDITVNPRYSAGNTFSSKDLQVSPRYSVGKPFSSKDVKASPRYSTGSPFDGISWAWIKPAYSTNEDRFEVDKKKRQKYVYEGIEANFQGFSRKKLEWAVGLENILDSKSTKSFEGKAKIPRSDPEQPKNATSYTGDFKQKWIMDRQMHPSFRHHQANQDSELLRESSRKLNLLWTRVNGNKQQPNAVTDKISKPKFDRKEAEIWNE